MDDTVSLREYNPSKIMVYCYNSNILLSDPMSIIIKNASQHTFEF